MIAILLTLYDTRGCMIMHILHNHAILQKMKEITAFEANTGELYRTKAKCLAAEFNALHRLLVELAGISWAFPSDTTSERLVQIVDCAKKMERITTEYINEVMGF